MNTARFLAVLLLIGVPACFALAPAGASRAASDQEPQVEARQPSLAEIGPRPAPVPPPNPADIDKAVRGGVDFLVTSQNKNGSWGSPALKSGVPIMSPIPGGFDAYQCAVTALCISALIEIGGDRAEVRQSLQRGETWLLDNLPKLRRGSPDVLYNVWSHIYGIQAFVRMHQHHPDPALRTKLIELINDQIGFMIRYESVDKGWGYYDFRAEAQRPGTDSTSFMTAAALVAFREAKDIGADVPDKLVQGAVDSIHRQLLPDFSYLYGEYLKYQPRHPINRPGGSLGRSQACNLALRLWNDDKVTDKIIETWLDRLFARNGWLDIGRKRPIPHESYFSVAGYFYYFGHYYAGMCIAQVPAKDRPFYQDHMATVMLRLQGKDGSWWDYPLYNYHQQYGTAFALMTLKCCRRQAEP